jgi:hypothetical protein
MRLQVDPKQAAIISPGNLLDVWLAALPSNCKSVAILVAFVFQNAQLKIDRFRFVQ